MLVQVYNIALGKNDKVTCLVSDGHLCIKGFLQEKDKLRPGTYSLTKDSTKTPSSESSSILSPAQGIVLGSWILTSCASTSGLSETLSPS